MTDRPDETGEKRTTKRAGSDSGAGEKSLREGTQRARRAETGEDGRKGESAERAHIASALKSNAEFQRRTQGEAVPTRLDAAADARAAERNLGRAAEAHGDRSEFQRQWQRAGEAARREADAREYEWVGRGVRHEKVSGVDRTEYAGTWDSQKHHKYTRESIDASLRSLPEVRRRLDAGSTPDDLRRLHASADPRERQLARTFDSYYGQDAITIERDAQGRTRVLNGRHRLDSADQMGIDDLPMHVVEQVRRESGRS
ncbi:MAG: hypothetical protein HZA61_08590 [Candidatus Eisenbacteria bacterium]|uniref:ParB/Sulfiredoxin domain-containing protein n=1 Tax=Eiseniibacteriota bacterium TaxID=2212470 RepID=A0A933SD68_UNCEI|nr:hypothetical protein [Candidatus Eisenbacteria bacterium]